MKSLLLLAPLLLLTASPRPARACSCDMTGPWLFAPADGATDVPQDAMLWIGDGGYRGHLPSWFEVVDAESGAPRGGAFLAIEDEYVQSLAFAFDPPLAEGERVQLRSSDGQILTTFTVGARATSPAPGPVFVGPVRFASWWEELGSSCDPVTRVATVDVVSDGVITVLDTSGAATAGDGPRASGVAAIGDPARGVQLGMGDCTYGWPDAAPGAELTVRAGAFALNGTFSGWSGPTTLRFPYDPPIGAEKPTGEEPPGGDAGASDDDAGCAAAPGRPTAATLPLALVLLLLRRRRRR